MYSSSARPQLIALRALLVLSVGMVSAACGSADNTGSTLQFVDAGQEDPLRDADLARRVVDTQTPRAEVGVGADAVNPPPDVAPVPDVPSGDVVTPTPDIASDAGGPTEDTHSLSDVVAQDVPTGPEDALPSPDAVGGEDVSVQDVSEIADVVGSDAGLPSPDSNDEDAGTALPDVGEPACAVDEDCAPPEAVCMAAICLAGVCETQSTPVGTGCEVSAFGDSACTQGVCDAAGVCVASVLVDSVCDDGDPCTTGESCDAAGQCTGGMLTICPSTGPCELGLCDPASGCVPLPAADGLICNDGDPCTAQTVCDGGVCGGGNNLCACLDDTECYEDGNVCNGTPECVDLPAGGKGCQTNLDTVVTCPPSDNPCFVAVCVPQDGSCVEEVLAGASCDDGDPCTQGDTCDDAGGCGGVPIVCDDGVPCTDDLCDEGVCVFPSLDGAPCDDADPCTVVDSCLDAACKGTPKVCDDGNPCTNDQCDAASGICGTSFADGDGCDDGSACTADDTCEMGACVGVVVSCDDDNPCTDDACEPVTGCVHLPNADGCSDGDICTGPDVCEDGECKTTPIECDDGVPCTKDFCDPVKGCIHEGLSELCDDDNPCTTDKCLSGTGCLTVPNTLECDDASLCTFDDTCVGGLCVGEFILCNDGVECTKDGCDPATGFCVSEPLDTVCDDGNPCTVDGCDPVDGCLSIDDDGAPCDDDVACTDDDACLAGVCVPGTNICPCEVDGDCDDDDLCNGVYVCQPQADGLTECIAAVEPVVCPGVFGAPCLVNTCLPDTGDCFMVNAEEGAACPDDDACTSGEVCAEGACQLAEVDCDDGVACTLDTCLPDVGCVNTPSEDACDDGVACTMDSCLALTGCVHEPNDVVCADDVACTVDTCVPDDGCQHLDDSGPCDDGNPCSLDVCDLEDGCFSVLDDALCEDGDPCTADVCGAEGCEVTLVEGPCEDGNLCTVGDSCAAGVCQSGAPLDCEDGELCTKNSCSPSVGECESKPQEDGTSCEDGSACTELDTCTEGVCVPGADATCDDAIDCTLDTCDPLVGCEYTADQTACDDGNPCTVDVCILGQGCVHESVVDFSACDDGVNGTSPDVCIGGLCRGMQVESVSFPTLWCQIQAASLERVTALDGTVYALMNYALSGPICGTVPCADGGGLCHSQVLRLDGIAWTSLATLGGVLSGIGYDAIVGSAGQVGQITTNFWPVQWAGSDLAGVVAAAGQAGGIWTDVWGARTGDSGDRLYTLIGRTSATGAGRIVQCRLGEGGDECQNAKVDLGAGAWSSMTPVAVEGLMNEDLPLTSVVAQATDLTAESGLWLTEDSEEFDLHALSADVTVYGTTRSAIDSAWLVGSDNLVAQLAADGWSSWIVPVTNVVLELRAVTTLGSTLIAVGHDDSTNAWLVALDLTASPTAKESWQFVSLGENRRAHDVFASEHGVTVVGAEVQSSGITRPFLWYLSL